MAVFSVERHEFYVVLFRFVVDLALAVLAVDAVFDVMAVGSAMARATCASCGHDFLQTTCFHVYDLFFQSIS